jgi:hypothetical protein
MLISRAGSDVTITVMLTGDLRDAWASDRDRGIVHTFDDGLINRDASALVVVLIVEIGVKESVDETIQEIILPVRTDLPVLSSSPLR